VALTIAALVISMVLLGLAVRDLPIGTVYAVWTGIGAVGTVAAGERDNAPFAEQAELKDWIRATMAALRTEG
jgi:multidrug transporter EmrE-like cation transporter